jgi:hypothetical protein
MSTEKKCFVIMPISDQDGYHTGHFKRVYHHIIKPACEKAGFIAIRADEENKTNYIVIDIIRKIIEADIVICDLSAKNPNVMYELGLRQAFNKKSVLIKDNKTNRVFDIQGLRTIDYDEALRVDEVANTITAISVALIETMESAPEDINSLIQLLSIKPATIANNIEISKESGLILEAINDLSTRIGKLEKSGEQKVKDEPKPRAEVYEINGQEIEAGTNLYDRKGDFVGELVDVRDDLIYIRQNDRIFSMTKAQAAANTIDQLPF